MDRSNFNGRRSRDVESIRISATIPSGINPAARFTDTRTLEMQIYPAIDLSAAAKCVRLRQGDYAQETVFG